MVQLDLFISNEILKVKLHSAYPNEHLTRPKTTLRTLQPIFFVVSSVIMTSYDRAGVTC
jgi:hypothetical protein